MSSFCHEKCDPDVFRSLVTLIRIEADKHKYSPFLSEQGSHPLNTRSHKAIVSHPKVSVFVANVALTENDDGCGAVANLLVLRSRDLDQRLCGRVLHGDLPQNRIAVVRHHDASHRVHQHLQNVTQTRFIGNMRKEFVQHGVL